MDLALVRPQIGVVFCKMAYFPKNVAASDMSYDLVSLEIVWLSDFHFV